VRGFNIVTNDGGGLLIRFPGRLTADDRVQRVRSIGPNRPICSENGRQDRRLLADGIIFHRRRAYPVHNIVVARVDAYVTSMRETIPINWPRTTPLNGPDNVIISFASIIPFVIRTNARARPQRRNGVDAIRPKYWGEYRRRLLNSFCRKRPDE